MDFLNKVESELQMDWIQFAVVAGGLAFGTDVILGQLFSRIPVINGLAANFQLAILGGLYAIIGNWISRRYSS